VYISMLVCMYVCMYVCFYLFIYIYIYVCMYVCMNRAGSDGQLSYTKSLEHHTKKDVDIREKIAAVFIEKCTGW